MLIPSLTAETFWLSMMELALESGKVQDVGKSRGKGFLTGSGDPFSTFPEEFLI